MRQEERTRRIFMHMQQHQKKNASEEVAVQPIRHRLEAEDLVVEVESVGKIVPLDETENNNVPTLQIEETTETVAPTTNSHRFKKKVK